MKKELEQKLTGLSAKKLKMNELSTTASRIAKLRKQASNGIEVWQPEDGDTLAGELIGHQKAVGVYGENFQILVKDENGNTVAAWLTQWLKQNLQAQNTEIGDIIALTFLGKKQSPAGRPYNAYSLLVEKI